MAKQKTKEELQKELAMASMEIDNLNRRLESLMTTNRTGSEDIRKEFARAFRWDKPKKQFDYGSAEIYIPTWIEIFVELGKLLNSRHFMDFEDNFSALENKVEQLDIFLKEHKQEQGE